MIGNLLHLLTKHCHMFTSAVVCKDILPDSLLPVLVLLHRWVAVAAAAAEETKAASLHVTQQSLRLLNICIDLQKHRQGVSCMDPCLA